MAKKWLLSLVITFFIITAIPFLANNIKVSFDKDSKYVAELPKTMRTAHIKNESDKDFYKNIYISRTKLPEIGDEDVLVYVKSATFTQRDFSFFKSNKDKKEFVPCSDFSGVVVRVGKKVKRYEIGDKVFGIADLENGKGACADYVSVAQNNIYTLPYSLTFKQAAMIPTPALLNWFTLHNLEKQGLKKGKVLIDDAISEVGIMLTGLLSRNGFEVTAIDDESVETWVEGYGIKNFISNSAFETEKQKLLNSYDIVIDLNKGIPIKELIKLVKPKGTFITYEQTNEKRDDIRMLIIDNKLIDKEIFAKMSRLVHLGKLKVNVVQEYGLEHIRDAYIRAVKGNNNGKVVVNVNK